MATFDENGNYVKTTWKGGDKITAAKLNKIEESLEAINNNDVSRHVEADSRLDKLESGTASDKQQMNNKINTLETTVINNKDAADLELYSINQHMTLLDKKIDDGVAEVEAIANTVDGKIAAADANMKAQIDSVNINMNNTLNNFQNEVNTQMNEFQNEIDEQLNDYLPLSGGTMTGDILAESPDKMLGSVEQPWGGIFLRDGIAMENDFGSCGLNTEGFFRYNAALKLQGGASGRMVHVDSDNLGVLPDGDGWNLGSDMNRWQSLYLSNGVFVNNGTMAIEMKGNSVECTTNRLYLRGGVDAGGIWVNSDDHRLEPNNNNAQWDLGSVGGAWRNLYTGPFQFYTEDNGYTSRIHCNRGNFRIVDGYGTSVFAWSHDHSQIGPDATNTINLGNSDFRWKTLYLNSQPNVSSDRTLKENIQYINSDESHVSYNDMYEFIKDDLELATYNLVDHKDLSMGFIAQDLLVNLDGTDNKVGQMIVNPVPVPTEEEIAEGKPYPTLSFDMGMYTSVLAGALKEAINKIEQLEARINELENK